jgi:hypothetical protein
MLCDTEAVLKKDEEALRVGQADALLSRLTSQRHEPVRS